MELPRAVRRFQLLQSHLCAVAAGGAGAGGAALEDDAAAVRAAYARAEVFTNVAGLNKYLNAGEARPHWCSDGHLWWLRRWTTPDGAPAKQFMVAAYRDGQVQKPAPAFDHERLAAGLADARLADEPPVPYALPFSALDVLERRGETPHLAFKVRSQRIRCSLLTYTCEPWPEQHRPIDGVPSPNGQYIAFVRQYTGSQSPRIPAAPPATGPRGASRRFPPAPPAPSRR